MCVWVVCFVWFCGCLGPHLGVTFMCFCMFVHRVCLSSYCWCIGCVAVVFCSLLYMVVECPITYHVSLVVSLLTIRAPPQRIIFFCLLLSTGMCPRLLIGPRVTRFACYPCPNPQIYSPTSIRTHICPPWACMDIPDPLLNYSTFCSFCYVLFSPLACVLSVFACVFWCVFYVYLP